MQPIRSKPLDLYDLLCSGTFDEAPIGIWLYEVERDEVCCNLAMKQYFDLGQESRVFPRQSFNKSISPDEIARQEELLDDIIQNRTDIYSQVTSYHRSNGDLIWLRETGRVLSRNSEGKVQTILGFSLDASTEIILEQKEHEVYDLIEALSIRFIDLDDFDLKIDLSLKEMGEFCNASRAYIFIIDEADATMSNTHEWCAQGIIPQKGILQNLPLADFSWWIKLLENQETIHIEDVSKLGDEAVSEREILTIQGIRSLLVMPITVDSKLKGYIGFDNDISQGRWDFRAVLELKFSSLLFSKVFQQHDSVKQFQKSMDEQIFLTSQLSESNEELTIYKHLFSSTHDCAFILDEDYHILEVNSAVTDTLGYKSIDLKFLNFFRLYSEDKVGIAKELFQKILDHTQEMFYLEMCTKSGVELVVENRVSKSAVNGKTYIFVLGRDITSVIQDQNQIKASMQYFRSSFDNNTAAMSIIDPLSGAYITVNNSWEKLTGFKKSEVIGKSGLDIGLYSEVELFQNLIKRVTKEKIISDVPAWIKTKEGNRKAIQFSLSLVQYQGNDQVLAAAIDVTNLQNNIALLEENVLSKTIELNESEEYYRILFHSSPIGVLILNHKNQYVMANQQCLTWFEEEYLREIGEFLENRLSKFVNLENFDTSKTSMETIELDTKQGIKTFQIHKKQLKTANSSLPKQLIFFEDVTLLNSANIAISRARDKAEASDRLKSSILSNLSHEFRTPLNGILGFTELILHSAAESDVKEMASMIDVSGRRLMQTLDSLVTIAQLEADPSIIKRHLIKQDLKATLDNITYRFTSSAKQKGLQIRSDYQDDLVIAYDATIIKTIVSNLVDNAIKFTNKGLVELVARIELIDDIKTLVIAIRDTGIGIPKEKLGTIYKPFEQVSQGLERSHEGSGIGLTIVDKYVHALGGRVDVSSEIDVGSTFSIFIPITTEDGTIESLPKDVIQENEVPRLLVVEDNMVNVMLIKAYLKYFQLNVSTAATGEEAIELCAQTQYDIILMDVNLGSGIDGVSATKQIREIQTYQAIPIIVVTGYTQFTEREHFIKSGFNFYLAKPFNQDQLIRALKMFITLKSNK